MREVAPQLVLLAVLVILNAAFAGSELALVSLREGQLQRLEQTSAAGERLARLARRPNQYLATIQIGITLAGFLASAAAAVAVAEPLVEPLGFLGRAAEPAAIVAVTLVLAYVTLVFGELAPKRVAMQRAERWALTVARPLSLLSSATRPVVWLLSRSTDIAVQLMGADPTIQREETTEAELRELLAAQRSFTPQQRQIIDGAFEIAERTLSEVLLPRRDVLVLDAEQDCAAGLRTLVASGHTRAPVAPGRNLDDVLGIVHLHDLVDASAVSVRDVAREATVLPDSAAVLTTMRVMQTTHTQMAIVVNEHGGVEGIVTLEDLIEELVGEIYDETDQMIQQVARHIDGSLVLPGRFPMHDLVDLGVELPSGEYATIAGLVLDRLGRIPTEPGDRVEIDGWVIEVRAVQGHAISEVRLVRAS